MRINKIYFFLGALLMLQACSSADEEPQVYDENLEIRGIEPIITSSTAQTRVAVTDPLKIGRSGFNAGDEMVFTKIERTSSVISEFSYSGIQYSTTDGKTWKRADEKGKIYWTDGESDHTFVGYILPRTDYPWTSTNNDATSGKTYSGQLATNFAKATDPADAIAKEDLLICYSTKTKAETGGLTTKVNFAHALSNVQVVVNIKDYSSQTTDKSVDVSDMVIEKQPTQFTWNDNTNDLTAISSQGSELKLWRMNAAGEGGSKTFTFVGLAVPHTGEVPFHFTVTVGSEPKTYHGTFSSVVFKRGVCTTLTINLNHEGEEIGTSVAYHDWEYVATPDLGELRKKSTFMDMEKLTGITTHGQDGLTIDDATWLYMDGAVMKDIYGNEGSAANPYIIKSAAQLLSFAREVNGGEFFTGKYIRLDADITMQAGTALTKEEGNEKGKTAISWEGIGDADHVFNGTFLGGDRYINRLAGSPLFVSLGENAVVEQLHITTVGTITGSGALAGTNNGVIGGCKVVDDVNTTGGVLVGTNNGIVYACYYTGSSDVPLVESENQGTTKGCYSVAKHSLHDMMQQDFVDTLNSALETLYNSNTSLTKFEFILNKGSYPTVKKK
jgi:hypothetical protein